MSRCVVAPCVGGWLLAVGVITTGCLPVERDQVASSVDQQGCVLPQIAPQSAVNIGGTSVASEYLFTRITGVARLPDGQIVVADSRPPAVRLYSAEGVFVREIARAGSGPGELQTVTGLLVNSHELWVGASSPPASPNTHVYSHSGAYLRTIATHLPSALFNSGSYLLSELTVRNEPEQLRATATDTMTLTVVTADGSRRTVGKFPGLVWVRTSQTGMRTQEFGPRLVIASHDDYGYVAWSQSRTVLVIDNFGVEVRRISHAAPHRAVAQGDRDSFSQRILTPPQAPLSGAAAAADRAAREAIAANMVFPDYHPYFNSIRLDPTGCLWAEQPVEGPGSRRTTFTVITAASGAMVGEVEMPTGFIPHQFGADFVIGVANNSDDVPIVQLYRLDRG